MRGGENPRNGVSFNIWGKMDEGFLERTSGNRGNRSIGLGKENRGRDLIINITILGDYFQNSIIAGPLYNLFNVRNTITSLVYEICME